MVDGMVWYCVCEFVCMGGWWCIVVVVCGGCCVFVCGGV